MTVDSGDPTTSIVKKILGRISGAVAPIIKLCVKCF